MSSTYEMLETFARSAGMAYGFLLFLGVLAYALWPANSEKFDEAAKSPLRED
jgi:cytochrome c oxidase cbb3-type subunit IV